jgi:hypothetical protein
MRYTRVGGIRFVRIGRLQFSFCVCRRSILPAFDDEAFVTYAICAVLAFAAA